MLFGKKEDKKKLPDLPPLKAQFRIEQNTNSYDETESMEPHSLPSFPDSPTYNEFSQAAIKDAVGVPEEELPPLPPSPQNKIKTIEMREWSPTLPPHEDEDGKFHLSDSPPEYEEDEEIIPPPKQIITKKFREVSKSTPDIFVRIDKFNLARKSLSQAQETLEQIDELIKKIRETKLREDHELSSWEQDMMNVKARIKEVSENIFEKLE